MGDIDRRSLVAGMVLAGSLAGTAKAVGATAEIGLKDLKKEADVAAVYHCDFGDPKRFEQMLTNISNHYSVYDGDPFAVQIVIVAHGQGVKYFLADLEGSPWKDEKIEPAVFERVANLAKSGLKVHLCAITFERLKLDKGKARSEPFLSFVPSGVATVAALQGKGFGYIKTG